MEKKGEFSMTLSSKAPGVYFKNTASHFKTELPHEVELEGDWKVALSKIIYKHSWTNVDEPDAQVYLYYKKPLECIYTEFLLSSEPDIIACKDLLQNASARYPKEFKHDWIVKVDIPKTFYNSPIGVMKSIVNQVEMLNEIGFKPQTVNPFSNSYVELPRGTAAQIDTQNTGWVSQLPQSDTPDTKKTQTHEGDRRSVDFSLILNSDEYSDSFVAKGPIAFIFKNANQYIKSMGLQKAEKVSDNLTFFYGNLTGKNGKFKVVDTLYIYSDIAEYNIVGNTTVQLLTTVPVQAKHNQVHCYEPYRLEYKQVLPKTVKSIEVNIANSLGDLIDFKGSGVEITLHFKKVGLL